MTTVDDCVLLDLQKIHNRKGNITVVEKDAPIPFEVKRVYYLYDVPGGEGRGGHAHRELRQLIVAAMGAFDVVLDDGSRKRKVTLNRPYQGLLLAPMIWREISNFSSGGICLVLASTAFNEADYIRCYDKFVDEKTCADAD